MTFFPLAEVDGTSGALPEILKDTQDVTGEYEWTSRGLSGM